MQTRSAILLFLLLVLLGLMCWSCIEPYDRQVWWTEMAMVFVLLAVFGGLYRRLRLSLISWFFIFLWCYLQVVGAHYTFELVPFDSVTRYLGFERNHYDRVAHFVVGLNAVGVAELLWRYGLAPGLRTAAVYSIVVVMAVANFWELVEWLYAEIDGGSAGLAFLGSQGDVWDAQKDMLMDTLGALVGAVIFLLAMRREAGAKPGEPAARDIGRPCPM
ncbi:MAG: DUF2238 domain-containing protein [Akkermansia sp.]|nr:DUF2238 domain-containing protein [Akkermansia sp.]